MIRNTLLCPAVAAISANFFLLSAPSPAVSITADLAKKCRAMAVKSHPPARAGTPYAQAERMFFSECIVKNGNMPEDSTPTAPMPGSK